MMPTNVTREIKRRASDAPCFMYFSNVLNDQIATLQELSKSAEIYYAMKANPNEGVLRAVLRNPVITGIEIASVGEAKKILAAGESNLARVIYTGPGKTQEDLDFVIAHNIRYITLESLVEANRINKIAKQQQKRQDVIVRINTNVEMHGAAVTFTAANTPSAFGIDEADIQVALTKIQQLQHVNIVGIHTYAATGIMSPQSLLESVRYTFDLCKKIEQTTGITLQRIDVGGGFGIDYEGETEFDVQTYTQGLQDLISTFNMQDKTLMLELGRYIVAKAGYFVTPITDIKRSKGKTVLVCEAGTNAHRRPYALKIAYPVHIIPMNTEPEFEDQPVVMNEHCMVTGPLCTSTDVLRQNVYITEAKIADLLVMEKSGAYGYTMSHTAFLSNNKTKEVLVEEEHE